MGLEREAKQRMKERQLTTLTATYYQARACETAIFPKHQALEYLTLGLTGEAGCLLYTSPSPRDGLLSRMPSSA